MTVEEEVLARADLLMQNAPGVVSVRRISQIDEVRVLRAARAELSDEETARLRQIRLEVMQRLDGAVAATTPAKRQTKKGLLGALLSPLLGAAKGMSAEMRSQGEFAHLANQAGGPARFPAPAALLDAAEAWVISQWVRDRIDADVTILRRCWDDASIESIN